MMSLRAMPRSNQGSARGASPNMPATPPRGLMLAHSRGLMMVKNHTPF